MTPMISQYKHVGACKEKEGREKGRTGTEGREVGNGREIPTSVIVT